MAALLVLGWSGIPAGEARGADPVADARQDLVRDLGGSPNDFVLLAERQVPAAGGMWAGKFLDSRTGLVHGEYRSAAGRVGSAEVLAEELASQVAGLPTLDRKADAPLVAAVRAQVPVAERLLWGNAASTVAAAKRLLVLQRPAAADRAADVAQAVLARGPFAGAGELLPPHDPDRNWSFRRRSCCLYYRVPGSEGLCDDCVLSAGRG
jgi:hypothetical protein